MHQQVTRIMGSFITKTSEYTLARLEYGIVFPDREPPPVLSRLPDASSRSLRDHWEAVEAELEAILVALRPVLTLPRNGEREEKAVRRLDRIVRELDQYARALRWIRTVNERGTWSEPPPG
ncbi:MAG: hypothetical protein WCE44_02110 [Candidatus Velthaea sp.]|jgi:hypothetical protein